MVAEMFLIGIGIGATFVGLFIPVAAAFAVVALIVNKISGKND